jgi:hypothetical protein
VRREDTLRRDDTLRRGMTDLLASSAKLKGFNFVRPE